MSVTKRVLEESHLALLDNGQIALCDHTKTGQLRIHRYISREEIVSMIQVMFVQFRKDNPDKQVLQIPLGSDLILAMTALEVPKPKEEQADQPKE